VGCEPSLDGGSHSPRRNRPRRYRPYRVSAEPPPLSGQRQKASQRASVTPSRSRKMRNSHISSHRAQRQKYTPKTSPATECHATKTLARVGRGVGSYVACHIPGTMARLHGIAASTQVTKGKGGPPRTMTGRASAGRSASSRNTPPTPSIKANPTTCLFAPGLLPGQPKSCQSRRLTPRAIAIHAGQYLATRDALARTNPETSRRRRASVKATPAGSRRSRRR